MASNLSLDQAYEIITANGRLRKPENQPLNYRLN
jgi:hypothetical protein